jgi:ABC-type phosphate/phosphonate transport system substrate-binding protein
MTHRRQILCIAAGALLPAAGRAAEPLRLGLAPFLSPTALLAAFRPMREQLERALGQPVELYTARDFRALASAVQRNEYDLAMLPAHLARVAVADWRWAPVARTLSATPVQVLVRGAGPVRAATDLRGAAVGMLDLMSLTAAVGARWLADQDLAGPGGAKIVPLPSIDSALYALERDEVAAVVAAASQLLSLPPQTPSGQRTLARLESIPGPMFVARPGVPTEALLRWGQALASVTPDPGKPPTVSNVRLVPLVAAELDSVEPYAVFLRHQLAAQR